MDVVGKVDWSFTTNGKVAEKNLKHVWQSSTQKQSQRDMPKNNELVDYCEFPKKITSTAFKDFGISLQNDGKKRLTRKN